MPNVFDRIREIVDLRIAARKKRREERRMMRPPLCKMCYGRMPPPASVMKKGLAELEGTVRQQCDETGMLTGVRFRKMAARLPENLKVPPVESRPPNLHAVNLSFAARLVIAVRDKFGGDAPKVYTAANVSRQAYSQIVSDETRPVSKRTAIRFAFALKSTPQEARRLLKSAGYAFSNSQTEDFILQACLEVNPPIWDLNAVNQLLREYRVDFQY